MIAKITIFSKINDVAVFFYIFKQALKNETEARGGGHENERGLFSSANNFSGGIK